MCEREVGRVGLIVRVVLLVTTAAVALRGLIVAIVQLVRRCAVVAFRVPTFNVTANVWVSQNPATPPPYGPPSYSVPCASRGWLVVSTRVGLLVVFPKGTDLRGSAPGWQASPPSVVEFPSATGRYYFVQFVEDKFKGYANEYRRALLFQQYTPFPIP